MGFLEVFVLLKRLKTPIGENKMRDDSHPVMAETELLIKKLRENPILAKLTDYALKRGIRLLVHPQSGEMSATDKFTWLFGDFSAIGGGCTIFIPFDKEKGTIIADSVSRQIFAFAHELGHHKIKDRFLFVEAVSQCRVWQDCFAKTNGNDVCILKELHADLEAARILKKNCRTAVKHHGWKVTLLNLWRQCSDCLRAVSQGSCPKRQEVARVLEELGKTAKICDEEITRLAEETKKPDA